MKRAAGTATPAFRKMRLVPIDDEEDMHVLEKRIRHYNPLVSTMAGLLPQIDKPKVKHGNYTAALAAQSASLEQYKSLERQLHDGPSQPVPPREVQAAPEAAAAAGPELFSEVPVPIMYRTKLSRLIDHLGKHPGAIARTPDDELVIDGAVQRGTSFSGAVRSLYVNSSLPAPGTRQLAAKLRSLGAPREFVSSKYAVTLLRQGGAGIRWPGKPSRMLRLYK